MGVRCCSASSCAESVLRTGLQPRLPQLRSRRLQQRQQGTLAGDAAIGKAIQGLAGKRSAVLLANHGPVVAAKDLEAAVYAMEELEETARLALLTRGMSPKMLTPEQVRDVVDHFNIEWD